MSFEDGARVRFALVLVALAAFDRAIRATYVAGEPITFHAWSRDGKMLAFVRSATERHLVLLRDAVSGR